MKALSLAQPWATLVALGAKRIETRSGGTSYRGPLAIHATKAFPAYAQALVGQPVFRDALKPVIEWPYQHVDKAFPRGAIIAVCQLSRVMWTWQALCLPDFSGQEWEFGNYSPGLHAWVLEDVRPLPQPILVKGRRGLWDVPDDLLRAMNLAVQ